MKWIAVHVGKYGEWTSWIVCGRNNAGFVKEPTLVPTENNEGIIRAPAVMVACSDNFSLLLTTNTRVFRCGEGFGGVEPHVRVVPVQTFFDYTEREKFLRDNKELQVYLTELAVVPELLDRASTLRLVRFSYPDYTKECFFVVRRVFGNKQNSYLYFNNLLHLRFHLTATNCMPFNYGANTEWPAAHHHRGL